MSDISGEQLCVCTNCWRKVTVTVEKPEDTGRPEGWGYLRLSLEGTPNGDSLICDNCFGWIKQGLETARELEEHNLVGAELNELNERNAARKKRLKEIKENMNGTEKE